MSSCYAHQTWILVTAPPDFREGSFELSWTLLAQEKSPLPLLGSGCSLQSPGTFSEPFACQMATSSLSGRCPKQSFLLCCAIDFSRYVVPTTQSNRGFAWTELQTTTWIIWWVLLKRFAVFLPRNCAIFCAQEKCSFLLQWQGALSPYRSRYGLLLLIWGARIHAIFIWAGFL